MMNNLPAQKEQKKDIAAKPAVVSKPVVAAAKPKATAVSAPAKKPSNLVSSAPAVQQAQAKPTPTTAKPAAKSSGKRLALVLVRGFIRAREDIVATLFTLRLRKGHSCTVIDDTPSLRAAAVKCKDYITYGEIDDETYKLLVEKRGKKNKDGSLKKFFSLHPPRGGFDRKGIKTPFTNGGALGYRGAKINDLIKKIL